MNIFITNFKEKAHNKNLTAADMLALCLFRAVKAKSPEKIAIARHFIKKSFSPNKHGDWIGLNNAYNTLNRQTSRTIRNAETGKYEMKDYILGLEMDKVFSEEEATLYKSLVSREVVFGDL